MERCAVITGDIVESSRIRSRKKLWQELKKTVDEVRAEDQLSIRFEIFQGDSFQLMPQSVHEVLRIAILLRAKLRTLNTSADSVLDLWDTRISIGIGTIRNREETLAESVGQAFEFSGRQLNDMKNTDDRLRVTTPWKAENEELELSCKLTDALISEWSRHSAELAYHYFLRKETQRELAKRFNISQPAVHKRMHFAHVSSVEAFLKRFNTLMDRRLG